MSIVPAVIVMSSIEPTEPSSEPDEPSDGASIGNARLYQTAEEPPLLSSHVQAGGLTTEPEPARETIHQADAGAMNSPANQARTGPPVLAAALLATAFTAVVVLLSGLSVAALAGVVASGILTACWGLLNYRVCQERSPCGVSPMRVLAMSFFVNQFGAAHAVLFANAMFQIIFPVIHTLHPPAIVLTFAAIIGFLTAFLLVALVACLTVWWHIQLAGKLYGVAPGNTRIGVAIGLTFAATGVWIIANLGSEHFLAIAAISANACFILVFLFQRALLLSGKSVERAVPVLDGRRLTIEWLFLSIYALTVVFSASSPTVYSTAASVFSGLPVAIWLAYLLSEKKACTVKELSDS